MMMAPEAAPQRTEEASGAETTSPPVGRIKVRRRCPRAMGRMGTLDLLFTLR